MMRSFKFARTRHVYDSYQDFWRMVELANLPVCFVDEIDPDADCDYVTTPLTGELKSRQLFSRKCRIIWWNLERPDGEFAPGYDGVLDDALQYVDRIWVSDLAYQALAPDRTVFVIMGSRKELAIPATHFTQVGDIAHYSYMNGRRNHIYGRLQEIGLRLTPNGWGAERSVGLQLSKLFLNVHQTDALIGEPLRFAVAAAYKTLLVSERLAAPYPMVPNVDYLECDYNDIPETCRRLVDDDLAMATAKLRGHSLHQRLCIEHEFPNGALLAIGGY